MSLLLLLTPLLPLLAALPGGRWALPVLAPLTLYPAFAARVGRRDYFGAWKLGIAWALLLSLGVVLLVAWLPGVARGGILHGEPYRLEMFNWIATGEAPENHPSLFLPQHLLHLAAFLLLTWASGGYLGLVMGAALVAYMSYFVGSYAVASAHPLLGAIAAWVPWSVLRVAAFVLLGTVFARPLLARKLWPFTRLEYQLLLLAATGILADLLIKSLFAPTYGLFLRQLARSAGIAP
ncbi:MAG TPA: hypothetical protein VOA87_06045 [Thermoanaerobaculia bacterium]|nr:hypothetical protein [Thermoanaerobaculia bacterium]